MMVLPDTTLENCPRLDVICIGGGLGQAAIEDDPELLSFLRKQGSNAKFITSVCGGSMFLAKAGLLEGYERLHTGLCADKSLHWVWKLALSV